jgi:hypothetical protein
MHFEEREGKALEWIDLPVGMDKYRAAEMDIVVS